MVPPGRPDDLEALCHCHSRKRRDAGGQFLNFDFVILLIREMNAGYQDSVSGLVEAWLVRLWHLYLISLPERSAESDIECAEYMNKRVGHLRAAEINPISSRWQVISNLSTKSGPSFKTTAFVP